MTGCQLEEGHALADKILDVRGLRCPLPIIKAQRALNEIAIGATLVVLATDPGAPDDFKAFCHINGHALLESTAATCFRFVIRRKV